MYSAALATALVVTGAIANAQSTQPGAADVGAKSVAQIIRAFDDHRIVALGEQHRSSAFYAFVDKLISSPAFAATVNDIVVEMGNVRYQPLLDRYIRGEQVPRDSLVLVWRNTTQLLNWDSPVYEAFLKRVRAVNSKLPAGRRIRVLASDPPIDWSVTKAATDIPRSYGYRDWQGAEVIDREVLDRGRRALVIIGGTHLYRHPPRDGRDTMPPPLERATLGDALHRSHPGTAFLVETFNDETTTELGSRVQKLAKPGELLMLRGSPLGALNGRALFGRDTRVRRMVNGEMKLVPLSDADFPTLAEEVDALVYLGPDRIVPPVRATYTPAYVAEIRRRIVILSAYFGVDLWTDELNEILANGRKP